MCSNISMETMRRATQLSEARRDHVGGDDLRFLMPRSPGDDELLLRPGVRDTVTFASGYVLAIQRKRAPAASKLKDVLPVRKLGALAVKLQHREFRLVQSHAGLVVQATRVFQVAAQTKQVKFRGNLVVLLVRGFRLLGDCAGPGPSRNRFQPKLISVFAKLKRHFVLNRYRMPARRMKSGTRFISTTYGYVEKPEGTRMKWSVRCAVRGAVRQKTRGLGIGCLPQM